MKYLILSAAFALSACIAVADDTTNAPDLSNMDWQLVEVDGKAPGWSATVNLGESGRISGQAPCNRFFGALTYQGDSFKVGNLASTEMACLHMQGEAEFFALIAGVEKAKKMPGLLILTGGGHEMRFVQPID